MGEIPEEGEWAEGHQDDGKPVPTYNPEPQSNPTGTGASQGMTPVNFNLGIDGCVKDKTHFKFRVGDWKKSGEGMSAFVLYTVRCKSTAPGWTKNEIVTQRRYNEFLWLFKQLTTQNPYCIIPPLPEKTSVLNINSKFNEELLDHRQRELCRFLERVGAHPTLSLSSGLKTFMTPSPLPELAPAPAPAPTPAPQPTSSSSGGGWFSFVSDTISTIATTTAITKTTTEVDVFFENKSKYYQDLETTTLNLTNNSATYVANYRERVARTKAFVDVCQRISIAEGNSQTPGGGDVRVGNTFLQLMDVGTQRGMFDTRLADSVRDHWESDLKDAYRQIQQVRALLQTRFDLLGEYQNSTHLLSQRRDRLEKLPMGHQEYGKAQADVDEAQRMDEEARKKFTDASSSCKKELEFFESKRVVEIRNLISEFSKMHLEQVVMEEDLWKGMINHL